MWQTWDLLLTSSFPERTCYSASRSVVSWQPLAVSSFHNLLCVGAEVTLFMRLAPEAMTEQCSGVRTGHSHPTRTLRTGHQSSVLPVGLLRKHCTLTTPLLNPVHSPLLLQGSHPQKTFFTPNFISPSVYKRTHYRILTPVTSIILFYTYNNWDSRDSRNNHASLYKWKNWNPGHLSKLTMLTLLGCTKGGLEPCSKSFPSLVLFTSGDVKQTNEWQQKS